MQPSSGGRVLFELEREGDADVLYRASILTPSEVWRTNVTVRLADGEVTFDPWDPANPPAWLLAHARAFLRSEWKSRKADPEPWPSRILRWREEK